MDYLHSALAAYNDAVYNFQWNAGVTPLTGPKFIAAVWLAYWSTILGLKRWMADRKPFSLKATTALHNLILCVWSALMLYWMVTDVYKLAARREGGWKQVFGLTASEAADTDDKLLNAFWFHVYIYYVSKFYELLDTVILVLKKKNVIFLHWYHHTIVIAMVWMWCEYRVSFCSLGTMFNTLVHVFMYYYYMCAVLKWDVWFKRYITKLQIVQFMSSFVLSVGYVYMYFARATVGLPAFLFSCACNASFLYLFIAFDKREYGRKPGKREDETSAPSVTAASDAATSTGPKDGLRARRQHPSVAAH